MCRDNEEYIPKRLIRWSLTTGLNLDPHQIKVLFWYAITEIHLHGAGAYVKLLPSHGLGVDFLETSGMMVLDVIWA
jgi:hypothetical protein